MVETRAQYDVLKERLLTGTLEHPHAFSETVTSSPRMRSIFEYVETVAPTYQPVLITGETGVGKELIARAIHALSNRAGEMVTVNVASLDDSMFSDTLFGHVRGAFTSAEAHREGLIERAAGGTLFLDEIGDLSSASQVKLLRLLQEREYFPLGSDTRRMSDARVVAATNHDIEQLKASGKFRNDLYYRLKTHRVHIPPLRERLGDLPQLLDHFLRKASATLGKKKPTPPAELVTLLATYSFPGNIRELEAMVFDAVSRHRSRKLSMQSFKNHIANSTPSGGRASMALAGRDTTGFSDSLSGCAPTLREATEMLIHNAMVKARGNITIAAELLGISRSALSRRLQRRNPLESVTETS
jgi:DNA-binding NtrC family response regulator